MPSTQDVPIHSVIGIHREHGEDLLEQRPEDGVRDEQRDERTNTGPLVRIDLGTPEHRGEIADRRDDDQAGGHLGQIVQSDQPGHEAPAIAAIPATAISSAFGMALRGNGLPPPTVISEVPAEDHILRQAQRHTDRGRAEAVMEAHACLEQSGDHRSGERTDVDAQIEEVNPPSRRGSPSSYSVPSREDALAFKAPSRAR